VSSFVPLALATGLALSFAGIGIFVATIGFLVGVDVDIFRQAAAALLVAFGLVLMVPAFHVRLATAAGPAGDWAQRRFGGFGTGGIRAQFWPRPAAWSRLDALCRPYTRRGPVLALRSENLL
jgi:cytochrome c-type biogenesis protein